MRSGISIVADQLSLHPAERHALDYAINHGHGSIWLHLTEQQYRKLTG
jgi:hypothetical protein